MLPVTRTMLAFATFSVAALVMVPALYAHDDQGPSSSMMRGGMMGRGTMGGMMGRMMMNHCGAMMRGDRASDRPNDQWRYPRSPATMAKDKATAADRTSIWSP
jgi:hypothetical protein